MGQKTDKLINRFADLLGLKRKLIKRIWTEKSNSERATFRKAMETTIELAGNRVLNINDLTKELQNEIGAIEENCEKTL